MGPALPRPTCSKNMHLAALRQSARPEDCFSTVKLRKFANLSTLSFIDTLSGLQARMGRPTSCCTDDTCNGLTDLYMMPPGNAHAMNELEGFLSASKPLKRTSGSEIGKEQLPGVAQLPLKSRRAMRKFLPEKRVSHTTFDKSSTQHLALVALVPKLLYQSSWALE